MQTEIKSNTFNQALRENVRNYFSDNNLKKKGGFLVLLKAFVIVGFFLFSYVMMLMVGPSHHVLFFIFFFLTVFSQLMTSFAVMHDASHNALSKSKWLNALITHFLLSLGGASASIWRQKHVVGHHLHTNVSTKDSDIEGEPLFVFSQYQKKHSFHRFQYIYAIFFYCLLTIKWIVYDDFRDIIVNVHHLSFKKRVVCFIDTITSRLIYITISIVVPALVFKSWLYVMLFWFLYNTLLSVGLTLVFQCAHVNTKTQFFDPKTNKALDFSTHQIVSTVNYSVNNPVLTAYLGGLNFQVIHHLFPTINHRHYPAIQRILMKTLKGYPLITYNQFDSFGHAIFDHFRYLKQVAMS